MADDKLKIKFYTLQNGFISYKTISFDYLEINKKYFFIKICHIYKLFYIQTNVDKTEQ